MSRKFKEGQGRSRKVMEGQGRSFPITRLTFQVRKVMGGVMVWWWWPVVLYCQPQSKSLSSGLGFGTGLGLDNFHENLNCYPVNTDLYAIASEKPLCMEINPI